MAAYSEDLTCSICLTLFTDPVILVCGHAFCRDCITLSLSSQHQCPQCRAAVPTDGPCLLTNHILKSLSEKAKEAEKVKREGGNDEELCPEHEEKLKLFCVTDQQLACIICRDGEKHEGHKFKPVKEAAASIKKELETFVQQVSRDIQVIEGNANTQKEEIRKTKTKSEQLMMQISSQFEVMHQFLRQREDEIKTELKLKETEALEKMTEVLNGIESVWSESDELKEEVTSVLTTTDSEQLLKSWSDEKKLKADKRSFRPRGGSFQIVTSSLGLGPYESHLQVFMWKEMMIQVIEPRAQLMTPKSKSTNMSVYDDDGQSLFTAHKFKQPPYSYSRSSSRGKSLTCYSQTNYSGDVSAASEIQFSSEQHYWEVDVGQRESWELGVENNYLKYDGEYYMISGGQTSKVQLKHTPRKIGCYIKRSCRQLSFYDADTMKHIHTLTCNVSVPAAAYFNIQRTESDRNPLSVCWY